MKKVVTLFILLACSTCVFAQFKLSGKIDHYQGKEPLQINIPQVYGFYAANTIIIPVAKNGAFSITLPIARQKFGTLNFEQIPHLLLLNANKNLKISLDQTNKVINLVSGTALAENKLVGAVNIEEYAFFLQNTDPYSRLDYAGLSTRLVRPFLAARDRKIALINIAAVSADEKKPITAEVKYATNNSLYEFTAYAQNKAAFSKVLDDVFGKSNPKPDVFPGGPQYYKFVANYLDYQENKVLAQTRAQKLKGNVPVPYFGFTLDDANGIINKYGVAYLRCLSAIKYLPAPVAEQFVYQAIVRAFNDNYQATTEAMAKLFEQKFPASTYIADVKKKVKTLKSKQV